MNILKKQTLVFLFISLLIASGSAFGFSLFEDKNTIWEKNPNVYFKLVEQKKANFTKNDHPAKFDAKAISAVIGQLKVKTTNRFDSKSEVKQVFNAKQTKLLGQYLASALSQARPNQDVIFALEKKVNRGLGLISIGHFVAGTAFYKNNKLNIIIGDYDRSRDIGYEAANDPTHLGIVRYKLNHGKRSAPSKGFIHNFILVNGIENKVLNDQKRNNWLVIDVDVASQAYANQERVLKKSELAKKRKELRAILGSEEAEYREQLRRPAPAPITRSIEDRLTTLNKLLNKGLITEAEHQQKRQQIIDSL